MTMTMTRWSIGSELGVVLGIGGLGSIEFCIFAIKIGTMKRNCICLSCENLDRLELENNGVLKCGFRLDDNETIDGQLLSGETDKCPIDFYEKIKYEFDLFANQVPIVPYYAGYTPKDNPKPSYTCDTCSRCVDKKCEAFPEGIPFGIIFSNGHKDKLPGQNTDIVFDWKYKDLADGQ